MSRDTKPDLSLTEIRSSKEISEFTSEILAICEDPICRNKKPGLFANLFSTQAVYPEKWNTTSHVEFLYRGDARPPAQEVFKEGFVPKGTNTDLIYHALGSDPTESAYISTSKSKEVATGFPKPPPEGTNRAFVYEINPHKNAVDAVQELLPKFLRKLILKTLKFTAQNKKWLFDRK